MKYQLGNNETFELIWPDGNKVYISKSQAGSNYVFATTDYVNSKTYTPISITSLSASPTQGEVGSTTLNSITLTWVTSGSAAVKGEVGTYTNNSYNKIRNLTSSEVSAKKASSISTGFSSTSVATKTLMIKLEDGGNGNSGATGTEASKTVSVYYRNMFFAGAAVVSTLDSTFVRNLSTKTLISDPTTSVATSTEFSATAANNETYVWFAFPERMARGWTSSTAGSYDSTYASATDYCDILVNDNQNGGFNMPKKVSVSMPNNTTNIGYLLFQSTNAGSGPTKVKVTLPKK